MDETFLRLAVRLATIKAELGDEAYGDALGLAEIAVARAVLEAAELRAAEIPKDRPDGSASIIPFRGRRTVED